MAVPALDEKHFEALRGDRTVRKYQRLATPDHWRGLGCYLLALPVWLLAAVYGGYALDRAGLYPGRWLFFGLLALALVVPLLPIFVARRHAHRPALDKLAASVGMDYASHDFELKALDVVRPRLFGEDADEDLRDMIAGKEGRDDFAICQAEIEAGGATLYRGLLYWLKRRGKSAAFVSAVPLDAAGRLKLSDKAQRLPGLDDPAFDAVFATFSDKPDHGPAMLGPELRRLLLSHAAHGPVYFHLGQDNLLLAAGPPDGFEARAGTPRRDRLRAIFDNVAAALSVARALRAAL